jgi:hypothetical protein
LIQRETARGGGLRERERARAREGESESESESERWGERERHHKHMHNACTTRTQTYIYSVCIRSRDGERWYCVSLGIFVLYSLSAAGAPGVHSVCCSLAALSHLRTVFIKNSALGYAGRARARERERESGDIWRAEEEFDV